MSLRDRPQLNSIYSSNHKSQKTSLCPLPARPLRILRRFELYDLIVILSKALKKSENLNLHTITRDRISVSARVHELIEFCQIRTRFSFYDALRYFPIHEKIDVIVTFLALLELSRSAKTAKNRLRPKRRFDHEYCERELLYQT